MITAFRHGAYARDVRPQSGRSFKAHTSPPTALSDNSQLRHDNHHQASAVSTRSRLQLLSPSSLAPHGQYPSSPREMESGAPVPAQWDTVVSEVLIGTRPLSERIAQLGAEISADYDGLNPLLIVVLKGSYMFASDLSRGISIEHELEFIRARSYVGTESSGRVTIQGLDDVSLKGRHLIVIEDIVDTGLTLTNLYKSFEGAGATSIKTCSLLEKETTRRSSSVPRIDYVAFKIPDKFVIGYGLDVDQRFRHLPFVGVFRQT